MSIMASDDFQEEQATVTTPLWGQGSSSNSRHYSFHSAFMVCQFVPTLIGGVIEIIPDRGRLKGLYTVKILVVCEETNMAKVGVRSWIAFFLLGMSNNFGYVVMLTAAHDLLHGNGTTPAPNTTDEHRQCNQLSTGAILLADIVPSLFIKLIAPFFPLAIQMALILMLSGAGYILVAEAQNQWIAILGVVFTAFSSGLGETSLLSYMAFYKNKNVISTWSSGTGCAGFLGSIIYTGLTNGLKMSRRSTLYSLLCVPGVMGLSFWVLLEKPDIKLASQSSVGNRRKDKETFCEKIYSTPMLWKFMIPFGLVYFFEYLINQGLYELVQFPLDWLAYKDQYKWYQVDYQFGVFLSRSSINFITIKKTWLLALFQGINVVIFATEAVYAYMPSIYIILVAVLWEGLLGGASYVNTYKRITDEIPIEKQEFSMAFTSLADAIGITLAGFMSIPVHNAICKME